MKNKKVTFIAGFTGTLLIGLIAKMPQINAEDAPLCTEGADVAIAAGTGETYLTGNCTLNRDFSGNLVVGSNITATLNLNNRALSSTSGIALKNLGNLTITGEGTVSGSNTYAVQNQNTLRIEGGSYSINSDSNTSVIANGWNLTPSAGATPAEKPAGSANYATLEIAGGHFTGKINNVKNDENGIMKVSGGLFDSTSTSSSAAAILHGGKSLEITGGELQKRVLVQSMGIDKQKTISVSGGTIFNIAFDTSRTTVDPEVYHDVLFTGGHLSATLPSGINYGKVEVHDFSGGSFTYAGSGDTKIDAYNLNLSGGFSVNNGDVTEVTLRDSVVGQFSSINRGSLEVTNIDATSGGYIKSANGVIDIYNGQIGKEGKKIQTTNNGTINIHNGSVYGELNPTSGPINIYDGYIYSVFNPTKTGAINVFGGKFKNNTTALTTAVENGNLISGESKEIIEYQEGDETWYYVGYRKTTNIATSTNGSIELETPIEAIGDATLAIDPINEDSLSELQQKHKNLKAVFNVALSDETGNIIPIANNKLRLRINLPAKDRGYDHYSAVFINEAGEIAETFTTTIADDAIEFSPTHLSLFGIIAYNDPKPEPTPEQTPEPTPEPTPKPTPTPTPTPEPEPTPEPAPSEDPDDIPVPNTADTTIPATPNTGYDDGTGVLNPVTLLWALGFTSVAIAGVLALIKKHLKI